MSKRNKMSMKLIRGHVSQAVADRDHDAFLKMRMRLKERTFQRALKRDFASAVKNGEQDACAFMREHGQPPFQPGHLQAAIRAQDQDMIDFLLRNAGEEERLRMMTFQSLVLAVVLGMKDLAHTMASNGALQRSQGNRKLKTLSQYAIQTGNTEALDLALALFPQEATPRLYRYVLQATKQDQTIFDIPFPKLENPQVMISHIQSKGIKPEAIQMDTVFERSILGPIMGYSRAAPDPSNYALCELIRRGAPFSEQYFLRCGRSFVNTNDPVGKGRVLRKVEALGLLAEIRGYQEMDTYLDLEDLSERVSRLGDVDGLEEYLRHFLDEIGAAYMADTEPEDVQFDFDDEPPARMVVNL